MTLKNTLSAFVVLVVGVTVALATFLVEFIAKHSSRICNRVKPYHDEAG